MILCTIPHMDCECWVYENARQWRWAWERNALGTDSMVGVWLFEDDAILYRLRFGI